MRAGTSMHGSSIESQRKIEKRSEGNWLIRKGLAEWLRRRRRREFRGRCPPQGGIKQGLQVSHERRQGLDIVAGGNASENGYLTPRQYSLPIQAGNGAGETR